MPSHFIDIHPKDPQPRLIKQTVEIIREGGIVVYPTDSSYALGCHIGDKAAMERISRIRQTDKHHHFTLVCRDLSEIAKYARVSNQHYRTLKAFTPGPYTFILQATKETPKRLQNLVDAVIDGGNCGMEPTSVIDLEGPAPVILRRGKGEVSAFE